jgi:hypothetical protein
MRSFTMSNSGPEGQRNPVRGQRGLGLDDTQRPRPRGHAVRPLRRNSEGLDRASDVRRGARRIEATARRERLLPDGIRRPRLPLRSMVLACGPLVPPAIWRRCGLRRLPYSTPWFGSSDRTLILHSRTRTPPIARSIQRPGGGLCGDMGS